MNMGIDIKEMSTVLGLVLALGISIHIIFEMLTLPYYAKGPGFYRKEAFKSTEAKEACMKLLDIKLILFTIWGILAIIKIFPFGVDIFKYFFTIL